MTTLVLIHGNSQDPRVFDKLQLPDVLVKKITLPGHGGREIGDATSFLNIVKVIRQELEGLDNLVLCGFSLGGHVVHHLLDQVNSLGFISICAPPLNLATATEAFQPHPFAAYFFGVPLIAEKISDVTTVLATDPRDVVSLGESFLRTQPEIRSYIGESIMRGEIRDEVKLIEEYPGKKLFVLASADELVNNPYVFNLGIAETKSLAGKHVLPLDNPEELGFLLRTFLSDLR